MFCKLFLCSILAFSFARADEEILVKLSIKTGGATILKLDLFQKNPLIPCTMYNRNLVQLWVGLWCLRHYLWYQWLLSDSVTWQQRWTNLSKVDFGLWEANLDAECNLLKENWFWTLRLFLGCWFVLICSGVNDRQKGHTDEYTGENVLGTCFLFDLGKPSAIEVHKHFTRN